MKKQLHLISTGEQSKNELIQKVSLIHEYIDFIHLRERKWTAQDYVHVVKELKKAKVPAQKIIINDRVDIAYVKNVYGVQLAHHSLDPNYVSNFYPSLKIGCSVHSVEDAKAREKAGADFLIFGHIFPTKSKQGIPPRGLKQLIQVCNDVTIPVIAIGGIKPENIQSIVQSGATGIAVMSGILLAQDVEEAVRNYYSELQKKEDT